MQLGLMTPIATDSDDVSGTMGIGIAAQHHNTFFQMFKRLPAARLWGGLSVAGLAMVRKIVESTAAGILCTPPGAGDHVLL